MNYAYRPELVTKPPVYFSGSIFCTLAWSFFSRLLFHIAVNLQFAMPFPVPRRLSFRPTPHTPRPTVVTPSIGVVVFERNVLHRKPSGNRGTPD